MNCCSKNTRTTRRIRTDMQHNKLEVVIWFERVKCVCNDVADAWTNGNERGKCRFVCRIFVLAAWLTVVRTSISGWRTFPGLCIIIWLTGDHFVGKASAMGQPTRPTDKWIVIHVITWITGLKSQDHQTADLGCVCCLVAGQALWARAWAARPIGCTSALSVTQKRICSCGMRLVALYKCYMPSRLYHVLFSRCRSITIGLFNFLTQYECNCSFDEILHAVNICRSILAHHKLLHTPWAKSVRDGNFDFAIAPRLLNRFSWNLKYSVYNYLPDSTPHAKFQGALSTWVVWANS